MPKYKVGTTIDDKKTIEIYVSDVINPSEYFDIVGEQKDYSNDITKNSEYNVVERALQAKNMAISFDELNHVGESLRNVGLLPSINITNLRDNIESKYNSLTSITDTPDRLSGDMLPDISNRKKIIEQSPIPDKYSTGDELKNIHRIVDPNSTFLDEVEKLIVGNSIKSPSMSNRENILIIPKEDTIAKLFILPEWDSDTRSRISDDSYKSKSYVTADFMLNSVNERDAEKYQIIETFGDDIIYFYGKRPSVYSFSGILLNTENHQWRNNFYRLYMDKLRGTKCAENKTRVYLVYEDVIVEGYILNLDIRTDSNNYKISSFSFSMYITNQAHINKDNLNNTESIINGNI